MTDFATVCLLLCLSGQLAASTKFFNSFAGPYTIEILDGGQCDPKEVDMTHLRGWLVSLTRRYNSTLRRHLWDGSGQLNVTVRHAEYEGHLDLAKWDNVAGWRDHFYVINAGDPCVLAETYQHHLLKYIHLIHPTPPSHCPVPPNVYSVKNIAATYGSLQDFPVFPYGKYRAVGKAIDSRSKVTVGCGWGVAIVKPRAV